MEVHEREPMGSKGSTVTAYYRFEDSQHLIPLYPVDTFGNRDDAKTALTEWYFENAPTLLMTLAR